MTRFTDPLPGGVADHPEDRTGIAARGVSLTKFRDPLQIPPELRPSRAGQPLTIRLRAVQVRLHSELPLTRVWTYEGSFPGPTIEVQRGERLRVNWENELAGPIPITAVEATEGVQQPGRQGATPNADVAALPPWTVVHLHGAVTGGDNDGWTDNGVSPGGAQLAEYPNDQPSGTFWYHDHAMAITRWNVFAGLAGMYLIRDEEEDELDLPDNAQEVPLILCDRNLDVGPNGQLTGQLLYKVGIFSTHPQKLTIPFTGPFTLVNGTIWPHLKVASRWYRFRLLNASNARNYQLELRAQNGTALKGVMKQIGTDSGLLPAPLALDRLILSPGERADVLIDFATFAGQSITLVNTLNPPPEPGTTTPNPDIMQFQVRTTPGHDRFELPKQLSPSFVRYHHDTAPAHNHRWLVLTPPGPGHPAVWEMIEVDPSTVTIPSDGIVQVQTGPNKVYTLRRVARHMRDTVNFIVERDSWEQWVFLHLGGPSLHPMHIHLIRFQALAREQYDIRSFDPLLGGTTTPVVPAGPGTLDPNEQGWKDVIRVGPGQLVRILGRFIGATGQFMYHCHVLEHEDENMMRPFVVLPSEVIAVDPHSGGHGGGGHGH